MGGCVQAENHGIQLTMFHLYIHQTWTSIPLSYHFRIRGIRWWHQKITKINERRVNKGVKMTTTPKLLDQDYSRMMPHESREWPLLIKPNSAIFTVSIKNIVKRKFPIFASPLSQFNHVTLRQCTNPVWKHQTNEGKSSTKICALFANRKSKYQNAVAQRRPMMNNMKFSTKYLRFWKSEEISHIISYKKSPEAKATKNWQMRSFVFIRYLAVKIFKEFLQTMSDPWVLLNRPTNVPFHLQSCRGKRRSLSLRKCVCFAKE